MALATPGGVAAGQSSPDGDAEDRDGGATYYGKQDTDANGCHLNSLGALEIASYTNQWYSRGGEIDSSPSYSCADQSRKTKADAFEAHLNITYGDN